MHLTAAGDEVPEVACQFLPSFRTMKLTSGRDSTVISIWGGREEAVTRNIGQP